jgi:hypothetical protein
MDACTKAAETGTVLMDGSRAPEVKVVPIGVSGLKAKPKARVKPVSKVPCRTLPPLLVLNFPAAHREG